MKYKNVILSVLGKKVQEVCYLLSDNHEANKFINIKCKPFECTFSFI